MTATVDNRRRARAAPDPQAVGWRIVPVEPTPEMLKAELQSRAGVIVYPGEAWRVMVRASPVPEGLREKIARIIQPGDFEVLDGAGDASPHDQNLAKSYAAKALTMADAILSLLSQGDSRC